MFSVTFKMSALSAVMEVPLFQSEPALHWIWVLEKYCDSCFDAAGCSLKIWWSTWLAAMSHRTWKLLSLFTENRNSEMISTEQKHNAMKPNEWYKLQFVAKRGVCWLYAMSLCAPCRGCVGWSAFTQLPITIPYPHCEKFMHLPSKELGMIKHSDSDSENGGWNGFSFSLCVFLCVCVCVLLLSLSLLLRIMFFPQMMLSVSYCVRTDWTESEGKKKGW